MPLVVEQSFIEFLGRQHVAMICYLECFPLLLRVSVVFGGWLPSYPAQDCQLESLVGSLQKSS